ncbi:GNAT family N-acetyltransferase [Sphaerisporangium rhizosphaerae]|uniref:GNAT family N-acetyltransferase n=1 Tax=Sphaerisporangium rhizosphaerae TaxID=2269375 RepID=A0ABW2P7B7_9ACTN
MLPPLPRLPGLPRYPRETVQAGPYLLRPPAKDDIDAITRACADPEIAAYVPSVPVPYTADDARVFVTETAPGTWEAGGAYFAIADPATGDWLGNALLKPPSAAGNAEIGYMVAPWARRRGVATIVTRALSEWAYQHGTHRVELLTDLENTASQRVAMAAGYRREGVLREAASRKDGGGRTDLVLYGRLATDPGTPQRSYLPDLPGGSLSDGVVRLAPLTLADVDAYQAMMSEPDVLVRSVPPLAPLREESVYRARCTGMWWLAGERAELGVHDAATGEFAGHIQLMNVNQALGQAMIGYSLAGRFRGRGFMTRAVDLLCEWAFTNTPLHRIVAGTATDNTPSHRVLERAGFEREALVKALLPGADGTRHDDLQWVRLRG